MGNLQTAINDKAGTLESQNFLDADEQNVMLTIKLYQLPKQF